jgi:hypothetical protein
MLYVGIDPGLGGGIAAIDARGTIIRVARMPRRDRDIIRIFRELKKLDTCFGMLEDVWSTPQMGVVSAFTFGVGKGKLLMALCATGMPYAKVAPIKWQNVMDCRTPKEVRAELGHKDKNINRARAMEVFQLAEVTHALADALLLAEYCRRVRGSMLFDTSAGEGNDGKTRNTQQRTAPAVARRHRRRT